jgi:mycofactocin precursor
MSERVATADVIEVPAAAAEPGLAQGELSELAEAELLVEEVSIDGMCGVY